MKKQLKIGAYLRVSTDRQVQVFEGSLETQKYRMEEFVKARNRENKSWGENHCRIDHVWDQPNDRRMDTS